MEEDTPPPNQASGNGKEEAVADNYLTPSARNSDSETQQDNNDLVLDSSPMDLELEDEEVVTLENAGQKPNYFTQFGSPPPSKMKKTRTPNWEGTSDQEGKMGWHVPGRRFTVATVRESFIGNREMSAAFSKKPIALRVDAEVGGIQGKVAKAFAPNMTIGDVVQFLLKRFPEVEGEHGLYFPGSETTEPFWLDSEKKLCDYDENLFKQHFLKLKAKFFEFKRPQSKSTSKAPIPKNFLSDPNAKITISSVISDSPADDEAAFRQSIKSSLVITFEYIPRAPNNSSIHKEGEVSVQGSSGTSNNKGFGSFLKSNWRTRYLVLQGDKLFFYRSKVKDAELPYLAFNLKGAKLTESHDKSTKLYCFEIQEQQQFSGLESSTQRSEMIGVKTKEDYEEWTSLILEQTVELQDNSLPTSISQRLSISYDTLTGYVGLSKEWQQALNDCGITERYFYENPQEVLELLKANMKNTGQDLSTTPHRTQSRDIGDVVNKNVSPDSMYSNFQLIGSGTFGEVYRAVNSRSGQKCAIKKMLLTPKREPLFINEISVQKSTEHPNVVKLFDAFKVDDHIWVSLEYMEHGNLFQVLSTLESSMQSMKESFIAYIMLESLKALSYIHGKHRIHRDIKSDNLLIGSRGEIKLADFGYAVQLSDEEEKRQTLCGSPYWMAPEVIKGEKYGKPVDIWSLGIMLIECCDLQPPFITESPSKGKYC
eukprot:TRINITY_DN4874_c0_g1_i1.p1 TRINITY_DN4874_c0_g1~~TRINITY_DN4874_c0_g1_i1.p1  ORF type:complete len:716 (+),score=166.16 TRINITY_DN4874_c0_g1_i1:26-2149(+)